VEVSVMMHLSGCKNAGEAKEKYYEWCYEICFYMNPIK
jgi:hypothetical protein